MQISKININNFSKYKTLSTRTNGIIRNAQINNDSIHFSGQYQLFSEKLSLDDEATKKTIFKLDDETFRELIDFKTYENFWKYTQEKNITTYLVKNGNNQLLGYYQVWMPSENNMYIETINLKANYRGKKTGFTTHVFRQINELAKAKGASVLSLCVSEKNTQAMNLYKRHGFKIIKKHDNFFANGPSYYMEKML